MTWQEEADRQEKADERREKRRARKIQIVVNDRVVGEISFGQIEDLRDLLPSDKKPIIDKLCLLFDEHKEWAEEYIDRLHEDNRRKDAEIEEGKKTKAELQKVTAESEQRDKTFKQVTRYTSEIFHKIRNNPVQEGQNILPSHYKVLAILRDIGPLTFSDWLRACVKSNLTRHDNTLNRWLKSLRGMELIDRDDATEKYSISEGGRAALAKVEDNSKKIT